MDGGVHVALERRPEALAWLRVSGRLRPGWCGNLAAGLAGRGIGIARGWAVTVGVGSWRAEFELTCVPAERPTRSELFRMLAADAGAGFATPIALFRYELARSTTRGGCLSLEVEGEDGVGFLAALLRRLAYFSLFPAELRLETFGRRVHDQLWLRAVGGRSPMPRVEKALGASLDALLRSDA